MEKRICHNCGVELDLGIDTCPLCGDSDHEKNNDNNRSELTPSSLLRMSEKERKKYAWELSAIICASAILISSIVDLVISSGLSWSLYTIIVACGLWVILTLIIFAGKRIYILAPGLLINLLGVLVLFDLINRPINWFVGLGLPFASSLVILLTGLLILIKNVKWKGFNILALTLIAITIECVVFETFIDLYIDKSVSIGWSAITASAIIPFSGILIFIHYRLKRGKNLGSYFHV